MSTSAAIETFIITSGYNHFTQDPKEGKITKCKIKDAGSNCRFYQAPETAPRKVSDKQQFITETECLYMKV